MDNYFFTFWSILLEIIDLYLDPDLEPNKKILDLHLNWILVIKQIIFDHEQFSIILFVKITIVITRRYTINEIRCSENSKIFPVLGRSFYLS